jgi:DNA-binding MarR family transcriptional regulator
MSALGSKRVDRVAETCLCGHIQRASRALGRRFDRHLRPLGLNNWQFSLLMAIVNEPLPPSVGSLSEILGMEHTTTTKNLRLLHRRGLVASRGDAEDARVRRIALTPLGRALIARAIPRWRAINDAMLAKLTADQLAGLKSALEAIAED